MFKIIKGDLIALKDQFDVIAHGCNTQSRQKNGIAKQMVIEFGTDNFPMERLGPNIQKLGRIDYQTTGNLTVVNCYTQMYWGTDTRKLNYGALAECIRLLGTLFSGRRIGLPWIGCGLAGGDKEIVREIVEFYSDLADFTIVEYNN